MIALGWTDGNSVSSYFGTIRALTQDGQGNIYISDHATDANGLSIDSIRRMAIATLNVTTMAGKTGQFLFAIFDYRSYVIILTIFINDSFCSLYSCFT